MLLTDWAKWTEADGIMLGPECSANEMGGMD